MHGIPWLTYLQTLFKTIGHRPLRTEMFVLEMLLTASYNI